MPFVLTPPEQPEAPQGSFVLSPPSVPLASNPVDEMSTTQRSLAGAGSTVADWMQGLKTLLAKSSASGLTDLMAQDPSGFNAFQKPTDTRAVGKEWLDQLHGEAAQKRAVDANLDATTAGKVGKIGMNVAASIPTAGTGLVGAGITGAAFGALEPTTEEDSVAWNALKSGVLGMGGQVVADAFGAILRGVKPSNEQIAAAKEFADKWGGTISRGQLTGSEMLQRIERMANSVGSKFGPRAQEANSGAVKRAVDSVTGGDAGAAYRDLAPYTMKVEQGVVDAANQPARFTTVDQGKLFSDLRDMFAPPPGVQGLGPRALAQLQAKGVQTGARFPVGSDMPMTGAMGDFENAQGLRSLFSKEAHKAGQETPAGAAFSNVADAFQDAMNKSLQAQGAGANVMTRLQNAYSLEKITQKAAIHDASGDIIGYDPAKIAAEVQRIERTSPGRLDRMGEVGDMLRKAAAFGRTTKPVNSSGTSENAIAGKVAGLEMVKDAVGAIMKGGNVAGAVMQAMSPIAGAVYAPRLVNAIMQATRNGVLPEAKGAAGRKAADILGQVGTGAARALPLTLSLGDLLPAGGSGQ